ncbi:MAG TPA: MFS transporter [Steroidobacteraceae bacterium]|nr:MFS transporter [Steroidobacteraceae bacterium]
MAGGVSEVVAPAARAGPGVQPWPARGAAYYALLIIILATMLNFLDAQVFGMMAQRIKVDLNLTDEQLGFLIGPANVIFYVLIGIPMARLVDIYPRKIVLAGGIAAIGGITALGGLAQSFGQLFSSRMLVGAGGSAHAPGAYSMLSDYFPPAKLPRAIGFLQLGFIGGNALGIFLGGQLVSLAAAWPVSHWMGLTVRGWQWVLMMVGFPGLLISGLLLLVKEPARRGVTAHGKRLPVTAVLREIRARKAIYLPLFIGLAFSATQAIGMLPWRAPFLIRTYGWNEAQIGRWMGIMFLASSLIGAAFGTLFVEWLSKRYQDANVRAAAILFAIAAPFEIAAPLMPSGGLALLCLGLAGACGIASAVPQNAAIQRITPNEMRGQVTAIYLFMFIVFGALGSQLIGSVTQRVFGSDADLWKSIVLTASVLMPLAAFAISRGIKPYGREVERLERETA